MKYIRIKLNKCRVIFFDLEFYVPEKLRGNKGFVYNPWDKKCKLIGGAFFAANPVRDFKRESDYEFLELTGTQQPKIIMFIF